MSEHTIAFDLDSVLADVIITWIDEYNKRNNTKYKKENIIEWEIPNIIPITEEKCKMLFTFVWTDRWREIPPTEEGLAGTLKKIENKGYNILLLTKRDKNTIEYVIKWLELHDIIFDGISFIHNKISKHVYPFDVLIDDYPMNLIGIKKPKKGILFSQPWNHKFNWKFRINKLSELEKII